MKCPNCGNEIQEGHLICEQCGYEVRIVPDYDPVTDIGNTEYKLETEQENDGQSNTDNDNPNDDHEPVGAVNTKKGAALAISLVLILLVIIGVLVILILRTGSLDYKLNKVRKEAENSKYEEAISQLENLYVRHPDDSEILFLEADYYLELGKKDMAVDTLERMLTSGSYSTEDIYKVYDKIIAIYVDEENYTGIDQLLDQCEYSDIVTQYQNYLAMPPDFSTEGGVYTDIVKLKLSANTSGMIYYTLDGSVPNETSEIYKGTIELETGEYQVSALFVNQYGIKSEVVTQNYKIMVSAPEAPEVNYDTGSYTSPVMIEVTVPEGTNVYYTTDKSQPTVDSVPYTGPIPMPLNTSNFNFVAINDQGLSSEVVVRSYSLNFEGGLTEKQATDILRARLIEKGLLSDTLGHSTRAPGTYSYSATSAVHIGGQGDYYIIREFYHDGTGSTTTSDTTYLVEIYQGSVGILGGDVVNGFTAIAF